MPVDIYCPGKLGITKNDKLCSSEISGLQLTMKRRDRVEELLEMLLLHHFPNQFLDSIKA